MGRGKAGTADKTAALGEANVAQTARLASVTLDDKYTKTEGRVYLNGMQALTRLTVM